ncbi:MAG TPA: hypothetical protein VKO43_04345 [Candidatus Krumholzibacteriaceae bacterium]|nr:hypothetical protein [Candidatus Krumholzibacteriaceae bacterium]
MKIRSLLILPFLISLFSAQTNAQNRDTQPSVFSDYLNNAVTEGSVCIPGLDFKSSMGVSFASNGNQSQSMGYYMGHFNYGFGQSWDLNLDVGVRSVFAQHSQRTSPEVFIPNIDLTYDPPGSNFKLRLQFRQYRSLYGYRYSRWR